MTDNILIAIGGTGARLVESLIPCLLAGLGPDNLTIGFIDQDASNGNVARARERLQHYKDFRQEWTRGPSKLSWPDTKLARTNATSLIQDDLWCPHPNRDTTLASILERPRMTEDELAMFNLLYHADEREQSLRLGEGYRGLPHVGSAALVTEFVSGTAFWDKLLERVRGARAGAEVRIFLAGSVFGGMGAAGYPTLARVIRNVEAEERLGEVMLGGCLMLPYFSFAPPKPGEVAAKPEDLLVQAQGALTYYDKLFRRERIFNELYLAGWSPRFDLGYGSAGSETQRNPPLPPDLIGALSALRFFQADRDLGEPDNTAYICARASTLELDWEDLPNINDQRPAETRQQLGQLLRFAAAWRNTIRPQLKKRLLGWPSWAKNHKADKVSYADDGQQRALASLDQVIEDTIVWAASMAGFATRGGLKRFGLWDTGRLARFEPESPTDPVIAFDPITNDDRALEAFNALVTTEDEAARPRTQGELIDELSERRGESKHEGLGALVGAMFEAARLYADPRMAEA